MTEYIDGYLVQPFSRVQLRKQANQVHSIYGIAMDSWFPIVDFLECKLPKRDSHYHIEVVDPNQLLTGQHAVTMKDGSDIITRIRSDVYDGANRGNGRDRFTLAHELGHYLLHRNYFSQHLSTALEYKNTHGTNLPLYMNSEWQAEAFAGELLMPAEYVWKLKTIEISIRFQVSFEAAATQKTSSISMSRKATLFVEMKKHSLWLVSTTSNHIYSQNHSQTRNVLGLRNHLLAQCTARMATPIFGRCHIKSDI